MMSSCSAGLSGNISNKFPLEEVMGRTTSMLALPEPSSEFIQSVKYLKYSVSFLENETGSEAPLMMRTSERPSEF